MESQSNNSNTNYKYVMETLRVGSLTGAARELGISQPALTSGLNALEAKLGFKIFDRSTKPVSLTPEGRVYVTYLEKSETLKRECYEQIEDIRGTGAKNIVIGGPAVYAQTFIANAVTCFREKNKDCVIHIKTKSLPELIEDTKRGEMDCFICTSGDIPKGLMLKPMEKEKRFLCVPAHWEINEKLSEDMNYSLLSGLDYISLYDELPLQQEMNIFFKKKKVKTKVSVYVNQVSTGVRLAANGVGYAIATQAALEAMGDIIDSLKIYPLSLDIDDRNIYVAYNSERYVSKALEQFMEILLRKKEIVK